MSFTVVVVLPEELDEIYIKLRSLEIDIVDQAEVDRVKQPEPEEEPDKTRLDILDDPVRMYLKQMGQVPLLTREQEVEISKRIESAENELKKIIYGLGFAAKEHIALAEKLISQPEAVMRVAPSQLDELLHPIVDPAAEKAELAKIASRSTGEGRSTKKISSKRP